MQDNVRKLKIDELNKKQIAYLKYVIYYDSQIYDLSPEDFRFISTCNYDTDIPDEMVKRVFKDREIREDFFPDYNK